MLYAAMRYCHNFFVDKGYDRKYEIKNGTIDLDDFVQPNQYVLIEGSVFNDGVHKYNNELQLTSETFEGRVTALKIPKAFLDVVSDMEAYYEKTGNSPFVSETFGGYTYTRATSKSGGLMSVFEAFKSELKPWRKL